MAVGVASGSLSPVHNPVAELANRGKLFRAVPVNKANVIYIVDILAGLPSCPLFGGKVVGWVTNFVDSRSQVQLEVVGPTAWCRSEHSGFRVKRVESHY
jgi:hypothetical protein